MERVELTGGLALSRIVYGMWRLADDEDRSAPHVQAKIEACLEQGITSFDQADIYGGYTAEGVLGAALKAAPRLRERMEIVTKCGIVGPVGKYADRRLKHYDTSAGHIAASIDASLENMGLDRIDLMLLHRPDPLMDHHETGAALDRAVADGKVGAVGVSNFRPHDFTLLQSAMATPLATNQIEASLIAHEAFTDGDIAFLQERGIAPMAWSPLGGGALFAADHEALHHALRELGEAQGVDASAVAVAWLLRHPATLLPVVGTNNLDRIAALSDATKVEMDRETWFDLYTRARGAEVA